MIRVLLVEDQTIVREGLRTLMGLADGIRVVAEAANGVEALEYVGRVAVEVMLLDIRMPKMDGLAVLSELRARKSTVPVIVLTTFEDDETALAAMRLGARGYLLKDVSVAELRNAIHAVAAGGTMLRPAPFPWAPDEPEETAGPSASREAPSLTNREREIVRLMIGGYSNREIADALRLAEGTVKNHISSVLSKLAVRDRTRAVLKAIRLGYV